MEKRKRGRPRKERENLKEFILWLQPLDPEGLKILAAEESLKTGKNVIWQDLVRRWVIEQNEIVKKRMEEKDAGRS